MRGRDKFNKYKNLILFMVRIFSLFPYRMRTAMFDFFRMTNGSKGLVIRYILFKTLSKDCGENVSIHPSVYLFGLKNFSVGNNVSIHPMCYIDASGTIEIGDDVSIAHNTTILSTEHKFDNLEVTIKDQGVLEKKTIIHSNVWIAAGCRILAGTIIHSGSILASGSVVKAIVEKNSIYGGVPAKLIKKR